MEQVAHISEKDEQKIISKFIREVKKELIATPRQKKLLFGDLKADIREHMAEGKIADYGDIVSQFGTPEQIAKDFLSAANIAQVRKMILLRRIFVMTTAVFVFAFCSYHSYQLYDIYNASHTYVTETFEVDGKTVYEDKLVEDNRHSFSDVIAEFINRKDSES